MHATQWVCLMFGPTWVMRTQIYTWHLESYFSKLNN